MKPILLSLSLGLGLGLLPLAGCVQTIAESRVRTALVEAGVSQSDAACMAERMTDRLTIAQLRKLEALKARSGEAARPATLREYVERVRRVGDAEVLAVTASSAGLCAAGLD
jgi:hypothetical protein